MVEGMETVIATVSGYHGSERLKLIRLITAAGANYVGKMSKSTTHLICWKFKGKKYELAMKLGTIIVSHRWFEDCLKEGKHIPEHSYTEICGQDVGFIRSDLSVITEQARPLKENKLLLNKRTIHDYFKDVIDLDSDEIENDDFNVDLQLDEDLFPESKTITGRQRCKRKVIKEASKGSRQARVHSIRYNSEANVHTHDMFQSEESDYLPNCSNKQRGSPEVSFETDLGESSRRSWQLVKKNAKTGTTRLATSDTELRSRILLANSNDEPAASNLCNNSNEPRDKFEENIGSRHVNSSPAHGEIRDKTNHINDAGPPVDTGVQSNYIPDADARNLHEINSNYHNLKGDNKDKDLPINFASVQKSVELSCVICWTDFSSTRGVLPCGHRFCFSCIQNWADHMASNRKDTTCPLCKMSFASITRVDGAASLDQKIYSQTVPCASSSQDIFIIPEAGPIRSAQVPVPSVCCHCQSPHPVDLLLYCQICQISCVHSYCLDPPLFPWTCISCRDRRLFYQY